MANNRIQPPGIVVLAIMTTVTVVVWVGFTIYRAFTTKPPVNVSPEVLAPLSPTLDTNTLAKLGEKVYFERGSVNSFPIENRVISQPNSSESAVVEELVSSPSAVINEESTISGELQ